MFLVIIICVFLILWALRKYHLNHLTPEELAQRQAKILAYQQRQANKPPPKFLYGVGGTNNLPNPDYILWYQNRYHHRPTQQNQDDGYDGFLE